MSLLAGFARAAYYFFVEDGSIVIGAVMALVLVGILAIWRPFGTAEQVAGPFLFVLIAGLVIANLLQVARQARAGR
ncbi:MAG TPA: hypothetical protein VK821_10105 [Dehalococcoidia bacterium]|nr:hypothetical protein [Dehalococcoidia bacterium]